MSLTVRGANCRRVNASKSAKATARFKFSRFRDCHVNKDTYAVQGERQSDNYPPLSTIPSSTSDLVRTKHRPTPASVLTSIIGWLKSLSIFRFRLAGKKCDTERPDPWLAILDASIYAEKPQRINESPYRSSPYLFAASGKVTITHPSVQYRVQRRIWFEQNIDLPLLPY